MSVRTRWVVHGVREKLCQASSVMRRRRALRSTNRQGWSFESSNAFRIMMMQFWYFNENWIIARPREALSYLAFINGRNIQLLCATTQCACVIVEGFLGCPCCNSFFVLSLKMAKAAAARTSMKSGATESSARKKERRKKAQEKLFPLLCGEIRKALEGFLLAPVLCPCSKMPWRWQQYENWLCSEIIEGNLLGGRKVFSSFRNHLKHKQLRMAGGWDDSIITKSFVKSSLAWWKNGTFEVSCYGDMKVVLIM